jgi:hypothetical protein
LESAGERPGEEVSNSPRASKFPKPSSPTTVYSKRISIKPMARNGGGASRSYQNHVLALPGRGGPASKAKNPSRGIIAELLVGFRVRVEE